MTIREDAFRLFSKITNSPNVEEVVKVVEKLSPRVYFNKIYPTPVLGLLSYDELYSPEVIKDATRRDIQEELNSWSERERQVLYGIHNQFVNLNRLCTTKLEQELPHTVLAVDPLPYKRYYNPDFAKECEELLFTKADAEEMAQSFSNHPAFDAALSNLSNIKQNPLQIHTQGAVIKFTDELIEAGVGNDADWVEQLEKAEKINHPSSLFQRHIAALVCLSNSLANINQLAYQAIFQESLSHLNRGNIIDYLITTTKSGIGMSVTFLPNRELILLKPTDLVKLTVDKKFENKLCCIHNLSIGFNRPNNATARLVDDNMCSYGWLLK